MAAEGRKRRLTFKRVLRAIARVLLQVVCFVFTVLALPVYFYCLLRKFLTWVYLKCTQGSSVQFMSGEDSIWGLTFIDSPKNQAHVNAILFFSGKPDFARIVDTISDRLIDATDDNGNLKFRKLQQRIDRKFGYVLWRDVEDFRLQDHISVLTRDGEVVRFRSDSHLRDLVTELSRAPFKENASPWQMTIIPEFTSANGKSQDSHQCRYAVYFKVHHCIADGVSLVRVLLENLSDKESQLEFPVKPRKFGWLLNFLMYARAFINIPITLGHLLLQPDVNPLKVLELSGKKIFAWSQPVPLSVLKRIKTSTGTTVNDVVTSCVTGAVNRFIAETAAKDNFDADYENEDRSLSTIIPVSLHDLTEEPTLKNKLSLYRLALPLDQWDSMDQLTAVRRACDAMKNSADLASTYILTRYVVNTVPSLLLKWLVYATSSTLVFSNVPGPGEQMSLFGNPVTSAMFWVPQSGTVGAGVSILSYAGSVTFGIVLDTGVVPSEEDADRLLDYILKEIQMLLQRSEEISKQRDVVEEVSSKKDA